MATGGRHHSMPLPPAAAAATSTGKSRISSSTSASGLANNEKSSSSGTSRALSTREQSSRESIATNSNNHHHPHGIRDGGRDPALRDVGRDSVRDSSRDLAGRDLSRDSSRDFAGRDLSRDSSRDAAARDSGIGHGRTGQVRERGRVASVRDDLSVRDPSSSRERREDFSVRDSSSGRERREDLLVRDSSSSRERREDLLVRDSSNSREREGGLGKDHRVDRIRDRESVERAGRERIDRRDVNIGRQLQQRRREVAEGDRVVSPLLIPRPSSGGSGSGMLAILRSPVTSPGDVVVEKEGRGGGEGRGSGARAGISGRDAEREPGELTSESRVVESSWRGEVAISMPMNTRNGRNLKQQSQEADAAAVVGKRSPPKKRKFSPIVWDYDEKQARPNKISSVSAVSSASISVTRFGGTQPSQAVVVQSSSSAFVEKSSSSPLNENVATPSMPQSSDRATPPGSGGAHSTRGRSSSPMESTPSPSLAPARVSPVVLESNEDFPGNHVGDEVMASAISDDEPEPGQLLSEADSPVRESPAKIQVDGDEQDAPRPATIAASRWAEEIHTPDGDKSPRAGVMKGKKRRSSSLESEEGRVSSGQEGGHLTSGQSTSPEPGEYIREKVDPVPRGKDRANDSEGSGSGGHGSGGKDRRSNSIEDEEYDRELNKRELMELDQEPSDDDEEEQRPEVEPEFDGVPPISSGPQMRAIDMLQGCRSVDEFERLNRIDEGTYGVVYRARNKRTGEIVALKKVKMEKEKEGFPMTSLREINVLLSFHHPSVVDVKEVVVGSTIDSIFMVMEYMEHDLKGLMETMKQPFSQSEVKCLMLQLFEGVQYLHDNWVLHRDMKTSNLLLNNRGELKICDFGLARQYGSPLKPYTHMVVTLWYRAPELLLGSKNYQYSTAIDMWSLGCIMAEFLAKEALFNGKSELDQIDKIFKTLGTPNEKIWPEFAKLPGVKCNFVKQPYNRLKERFPPTAFAGRPVLSQNGFDLLNRLLTYDPQKRITAAEALNHEWFREVPLPKAKEFMPTFPARSEHDRRVRRLMKSPDPLEEQRKREIRQGELGGGFLFG